MIRCLAHRSGVETSLGQIFQTVFDTISLALILIKARKQSDVGLVALIAKQGIAYYMYVVFKSSGEFSLSRHNIQAERGDILYMDIYAHFCTGDYSFGSNTMVPNLWLYS